MSDGPYRSAPLTPPPRRMSFWPWRRLWCLLVGHRFGSTRIVPAHRVDSRMLDEVWPDPRIVEITVWERHCERCGLWDTELKLRYLDGLVQPKPGTISM